LSLVEDMWKFSPTIHGNTSITSIYSLMIISFCYYHWFCTYEIKIKVWTKCYV